MPDRRDFVSRARRHQQSEWTAGAARMAKGIELDYIQARRAAMTDAERDAERAADAAQDAADRDREARRNARREAMHRRRAEQHCDICDAAATHRIDGVLLCDSCREVLA